MLKSKIARRLSRNFAIALLIFALVIGGVFLLLFRNQTVENHKDELRRYAELLASALTGADDRDFRSGMERHGAYIRFIGEVSDTEVWVVDEDLQLITLAKGQGMMSGRYNYAELPAGADELIEDVFRGDTVYGEGFSDFLENPTLTIGAPIKNSKGDVWGAVLLHSSVDGTTEAVMRGLVILGISIVLALIVGVVLSVLLSDSFTRPLNKMKATAIRLSDGDYSARSGVKQKDEIGALSEVLDHLSVRLEEASRQSEKLEQMRRDYVANISHELKTPVTALRGSLEALNDQVVSEPGKVAEYHRRMLGEAKHLQRLVEDLLELSRLQNTEFPIEKQVLNICDVLADASQSASALAREKGIAIRTDFIVPLIRMNGDYGRIRQMFLAVLDNAVKFSPENGEIEVIASEQSISIRDFGLGISKEDIEHIFERFYKAVDDQNRSGTGLGLSIAKHIAERHGIRLLARNREEGGAEFVFEIPDPNEADFEK